MTNLHELFLGGNLFETIPDCVLKLTSVTELCFSNNQIVDISQNISHLQNLRTLHLNCNRLCKIVPAIGDCKSLTELDLAHNEIQILPNEFGFLECITDLDVSGNLLQGLPDSFICNDLRQLKIGYNRLLRFPRFEKADRIDQRRDTFISFAGNPAVSELLLIKNGDDSKKITKKLDKKEKEYLKHAKKEQRKKSKPEDFSSEDDGIQEVSIPHILPLSDTTDLFPYRLKVGWAETRGRRPDMQDTITVFTNFRSSPYRSLLCCFDGHSGEKSAELAARRILCVLTNQFEEKEKEKEKERDLKGRGGKRNHKTLEKEEDIIDVFTKSFYAIHREIYEKKTRRWYGSSCCFSGV